MYIRSIATTSIAIKPNHPIHLYFSIHFAIKLAAKAIRAIDRAKLYNDHVAETGNPNKPDKNGKTLFQKEAELFSKPVLTQEIKSRLEGLIPAGSKAKEFERQQIIANENNINTIRKKFPDAKIGEKYEIRGDTFVKVVN